MRIHSTLTKFLLTTYAVWVTLYMFMSTKEVEEVISFDIDATFPPPITVQHNDNRRMIEAKNIDHLVNETDVDWSQNFNDNYPLNGQLMHPAPWYKSGQVEPKRQKMLIGIISYDRIQLIKTLKSIFNHSIEVKHKEMICVVILLANVKRIADAKERIQNIRMEFTKEFESNKIEVIVPPLTLFPQNWSLVVQEASGELISIVKNRVTENLNAMFLMMYSYYKQDEYFLPLQEGAVATPDYIPHIINGVNIGKTQNWFYLNLGDEEVTGKLMKRESLPSFVSFCNTFWNVKSVETLFTIFLKIKMCSYDENYTICHRRMNPVKINQPIFINDEK